MELTQDRAQWRTLVKGALNLRVMTPESWLCIRWNKCSLGI